MFEQTKTGSCLRYLDIWHICTYILETFTNYVSTKACIQIKHAFPYFNYQIFRKIRKYKVNLINCIESNKLI